MEPLIRLRVLQGDQGDEIREAWISLLPRERWRFFLHPDWFEIARASYFPRARVRYHVAYEGDRIVGILPTSRRRMNRFGLFLPVVDALAGGRGDYSLPITGQEARPEVVRPLLESALSSARGAGTLVLANLPVETGVPGILESLLEERGLPFRHVEAPSLTLSLPPTFDEAEAAMKKGLRGDLRRQAKRIEESVGPLDFRVVTDPEEAKAHLPGLFEMHDRRWLEAGLPASFEDRSARDFYYGMIEKLWGEGLHFSLLRAGERVIAYHVGAVGGGYLLYYKPTFDHTLQNYSPGKLHLRFLLVHAIEAGLSGIDFLQGTEGYKRDWASSVTECGSYTVRTRRVSPSYFWLACGRPWTERVVGPAYNRWVARFERLVRRRAERG
ncbi:MAG: GNAT family N-acetyltransferase [Gemmatimonadota bacterium]